MTPLQMCRAALSGRLLDNDARKFFSVLSLRETHDWIARFYVLLMPKARRRKLAALTPPHLARHAIDILIGQGVVPHVTRMTRLRAGKARRSPSTYRLDCPTRRSES